MDELRKSDLGWVLMYQGKPVRVYTDKVRADEDFDLVGIGHDHTDWSIVEVSLFEQNGELGTEPF